MKMNLLDFNKLFLLFIITFLMSCNNTNKKYENTDYINISLNERYNQNSVNEHVIYLPQKNSLDTFYVQSGFRSSDRFIYCYHKSDSVSNDTIVYRKFRQTDGKPFLIVKIIQIK